MPHDLSWASAERTSKDIGELHNYEDGYPDVVSALPLGEWTVLVQPTGFWLETLADALSRRTEPDRLPLLREAGFDPDDSGQYDYAVSHTRPSRPENARALAVAIVAELRLGDTPGLAAALEAAGRGEPVVVTPESELGRHVREWSTSARRASWSLNDPSGRGRMSEDERERAYRPGHLVGALSGAFRADPA